MKSYEVDAGIIGGEALATQTYSYANHAVIAAQSIYAAMLLTIGKDEIHTPTIFNNIGRPECQRVTAEPRCKSFFVSIRKVHA
jgi:hypothetical protein